MKLVDVFTSARQLLQDSNTNSALRRYDDDILLGFANQTLKRIAVIRPDLFSMIGEVTCTVGEVLQSPPTDSIRIMDILRVKLGNSVREVNRQTMDQSHPEWADDDAGPCVNWMRHPRNANKFFIYPKAPTGQILICEYSQSPPIYDLTTEVALLPDAYFPCVVDGVVYLAEAVDSEHVNNQRADMFQRSLTGALTAALESRSVTDSDSAGLDKKGQA